MNVLGLSETFYASAALIRDGEPVAAIEEEKLTRKKGQRGLPLLAIEACLRAGVIGPQELDLIAVAGRNTPNVLLRHPRIYEKLMTKEERVFDLRGETRRFYRYGQTLLRRIPYGFEATDALSRRFLRVGLSRILPPSIR